MTGYGKAVAELPGKKIIVEIRSLNSKQFDMYVRLPAVYRVKEIELRNSLSHHLGRGKVDLTINIEEFSKDVSSRIDHNVVKQYQGELSLIAKELNISPPEDWFTVIMRLPDVMKQDVEELDEKEWEVISETVDKAVGNIIAFREQEGVMLEKVLRTNIENIRKLLQSIEPFEEERIEKVKSKLYEQLVNLEGIDYDKNRLEQEIIYYIEKLDIKEEKTRLAHHLNYFEDTLREESSQGKKLGFISQEIGREINTLGSKSNQSDMQKIVVQMKDELEQIKEQVLNIL